MSTHHGFLVPGVMRPSVSDRDLDAEILARPWTVDLLDFADMSAVSSDLAGTTPAVIGGPVMHVRVRGRPLAYVKHVAVGDGSVTCMGGQGAQFPGNRNYFARNANLPTPSADYQYECVAFTLLDPARTGRITHTSPSVRSLLYSANAVTATGTTERIMIPAPEKEVVAWGRYTPTGGVFGIRGVPGEVPFAVDPAAANTTSAFGITGGANPGIPQFNLRRLVKAFSPAALSADDEALLSRWCAARAGVLM